MGTKGINLFFPEKGYGAHHIMQLKCLTLCTPLAFWVGYKGQTLNSEVKYNLIELSDLVGFGYDLSATQDGLKCWRMGIIFCGKHPLLLTRIQVSDIQGSWALLLLIFNCMNAL